MNHTDYKIGELQKNHHLVRLYNEKYGKYWYFTNLNLAANFTGCKRNHLEYAYLKGVAVKGWKIDIVDGVNVRWNDINQTADYLKKYTEQQRNLFSTNQLDNLEHELREMQDEFTNDFAAKL